MSNQRNRRICGILICVSVLSALPTFSKPKIKEKAAVKKQNQKFIYCPDSVNFQLQTPAGWNAGLRDRILLKFESSATDGKVIYCEYEVNNAQYKNQATLTQDVPRGFRCRNDGLKSKRFTCEPNVPPIKIPKKNN
ncbi:MAG TPA: hypothetical protein VF599_08985 [Pyrinomonadaceae bacterium]|jgi:hypothetical protein